MDRADDGVGRYTSSGQDDAPIPALGGKSPYQAVLSKAGRVKVVDWLKTLENNSAKHRNDAIEEYDFGWMWVELGLEDYRK